MRNQHTSRLSLDQLQTVWLISFLAAAVASVCVLFGFAGFAHKRGAQVCHGRLQVVQSL